MSPCISIGVVTIIVSGMQLYKLLTLHRYVETHLSDELTKCLDTSSLSITEINQILIGPIYRQQ